MASGGIAVLKGNLAPDGCVVKQSAVAPSMMQHEGPARVFDSEEDAIKVIYEGGINAGDITVLSGRHAALLNSASSKLDQALDIINQDLGVDVCSQVVRAALCDTGEITGREVSEELAQTIFEKFCIGK
jgi:tRNA U34 5-carboxymethylaminomethyl modifying GTPase MnmE/TrmE